MKIKKHSEMMTELLMEELSNQIQPLVPNQLRNEVEEALNQRLGDEYTAYYFYLNAMNWCINEGYVNAGSFFKAESENELQHALKLQTFLTDWNLVPRIPKVETQFNFESLVQVINKAYELEYNLLMAYSDNAKALIVKDINAFGFIQQFIQIQNDSVKEFSDLLNVLRLIDHTDKYQLLYFENEYFK